MRKVYLVFVFLLPILFSSCREAEKPSDDNSGPFDQNKMADALEAFSDSSVDLETGMRMIDNALSNLVGKNDVETAVVSYNKALENYVKRLSEKNIVDKYVAIRLLVKRSRELPPKIVGPNTISTGTPPVKNAVIFINGINVSYDDFKFGLELLGKKLSNAPINANLDVYGVWNPTSTTPIWNILNDLAFECTPLFLAQWLESVSQRMANDPLTELLQQKLPGLYEKYDNVIFIPHSQGNLYVQYWMKEQSVERLIKTTLIETGSPAANWPVSLLGHSRFDIVDDIVAGIGYSFIQQHVDLFEFQRDGHWSNLWYMRAIEPATLKSHNFLNAYLSGDCGKWIVDDICFHTHKSPPAEHPFYQILGLWNWFSVDTAYYMNLYLSAYDLESYPSNERFISFSSGIIQGPGYFGGTSGLQIRPCSKTYGSLVQYNPALPGLTFSNGNSYNLELENDLQYINTDPSSPDYGTIVNIPPIDDPGCASFSALMTQWGDTYQQAPTQSIVRINRIE